MKSIIILLLISVSACSQQPRQQEPELTEQKAESYPSPTSAPQITSGTYVCWQNDQTSPGGMRPLGEMTVKGNTYAGEQYGKGNYSFDPSTQIVRFNGGGFDQRTNGKEWIGIFYRKGDTFLDASGGKATSTMLIITALSDWESGYKKSWIQQCDLK